MAGIDRMGRMRGKGIKSLKVNSEYPEYACKLHFLLGANDIRLVNGLV